MNDTYYGESSDPSNIIERTDQVVNSPVINSDPFVDNVPADPALMHETPMGGTLAAVGPMNAPVDVETTLPEIPVTGTVAATFPVTETVVQEVAVVETFPYQAPVVETAPYQVPAVEKMTYEAPVDAKVDPSTSLLTREVSEQFRTRWSAVQGKFVDDPRSAVQQADTLVADVIGEITQMFAKEHSSLESQWKQGNDVSTEDLRKALQHYRTFFNRLVV